MVARCCLLMLLTSAMLSTFILEQPRGAKLLNSLCVRAQVPVQVLAYSAQNLSLAKVAEVVLCGDTRDTFGCLGFSLKTKILCMICR